jgi:hypothetical protein
MLQSDEEGRDAAARLPPLYAFIREWIQEKALKKE